MCCQEVLRAFSLLFLILPFRSLKVPNDISDNGAENDQTTSTRDGETPAIPIEQNRKPWRL